MSQAGTGKQGPSPDGDLPSPAAEPDAPGRTENRPLSSVSLLATLFAVFTWGLSFPLLKVSLDVVHTDDRHRPG